MRQDLGLLVGSPTSKDLLGFNSGSLFSLELSKHQPEQGAEPMFSGEPVRLISVQQHPTPKSA